MKNVNQIFKTVNMKDYGPIPFWSWNNQLDKDELVRQIRSMNEVGMGGFIMHARTGLSTPYLGEEWFECIEACLDEAKRLGMNGWVYDENGWPSGFVGGELLKDKENLATYLELEEGAFDKEAFAVFIFEKGDFLRVTQPQEGQTHYNVYLKYSPANTDILKPSVVTKFIDMTYEKYYERFADRFGKELTGFFTDEPQYFRWSTPYTVMLEDFFKERYGADVKDGLIYLFKDMEQGYEFRVRYFSALNDLYTVNFYKRLNDWCDAHGCKFTGHSVEEGSCQYQMLGGAGCMPSYEYETIPGIDNLCKYGGAKVSARQVGSVAAQLGKKQVLTETFGCSGYDASPRLLRRIAEKQYVHGVNFLCHHLYSYSLAGQGKVDHPPCFSEHMTWGEDFGLFNEYFTKLGYLLAESKTNVRCAVLSPMSSIYLRYQRFDMSLADKVDAELFALQDMLEKYNIEYHFIDEKLLRKYGKVEGSSLVLGECRYDYLVVPYMPNVYASTAEVLKQYSAANGKTYAYGVPEYVDGTPADLSFVKSNVTMEEIKQGGAVVIGGDGVDYTYRTLGDVEFIFAINEGNGTASITFDKDFAEVDLFTGKAVQSSGAKTLEEGKSVLLMRGIEEVAEAPCFTQELDITDKFTYKDFTQNALTVDFISISFDGKNYSQPKYAYELFLELVESSYKGKLWVRYEFEAEAGIELTLRTEVNAGYDFTLNGKPITFKQSPFDLKFADADVTQYVVDGKNYYEYQIDYFQAPIVRYALFDPLATESVRNCLTFDTEIEQIYVLGKFALKDRKIVKPCTSVPMYNVEQNGFDHFAGAMTFTAEFEGEGTPALIQLGGEYMSASLSVNGKCYTATLDGEAIVETVKGKNTLELTFTASLRNLIGPLHFKGNEQGISPANFRLQGQYGVENSAYSPKHILKPVGISSVKIYK